MYQRVKTAKVEVVKPHDIRVGDLILWSSFRCSVVEIYDELVINRRFRIQQFVGEEDSEFEIPWYHTMYRILEAEMEDVAEYDDPDGDEHFGFR